MGQDESAMISKDDDLNDSTVQTNDTNLKGPSRLKQPSSFMSENVMDEEEQLFITPKVKAEGSVSKNSGQINPKSSINNRLG